jgi:ferredoxin
MDQRNGRICLVCSCENTMPLDTEALRRGAGAQGAELRLGEQLCRGQLDRFLAAAGEGRPVTMACTQEAPLFAQEAEASGASAPLSFVNLREHAGWSAEAARAGPKMAALLAAASVPLPPVPLVPLKSEGTTLVLGRDEVALAAAERLRDRLDLTVLLSGEQPVEPPRSAEYPILRGRARAASGWLGAFEVVVDGHAAPSPSSRGAFRWGATRDGARSRCDLILDLSGGPPLFPAAELRQGYLRADPADAASVERAVFDTAGLVGEFDKPRFVSFDAGLCAHRRNRRTGCTRCLDLCPTGAIAPGRDSVEISAEICAGCGACSAVCPTGAVTYALPPPAATAARLRALLTGFAEAGGRDPLLLLHDEAHGEALLHALARHGDGLPARVLPLRVNEMSQLDLGALAGALAWGAAGLRLLLPARRPHGAEGVFRNLEYLEAALAGLGLAPEAMPPPPPRAAAIETDDPFSLAEALLPALALRTGWAPASFLPLGEPREIARAAFRALHATAGPDAPPVVPMPKLAPFGLARVETAGCTLCLACTTVCPTGAFSANPDTPELRFLEDACVQCGLCASTCPERVIALEPRLNFDGSASAPLVVKAEAPFPCARCGVAFGTRSSIERVKRTLAESGHWMFQDPARLAALELCENCRVAEATEGGLDPYAGPPRPVTKTTEDWLREAERAKSDKAGSG